MSDKKQFDHQIDPPRKPRNETFEVLGSLPLPDVNLPDGAKPWGHRNLRMRRFDVDPDGIVPYHGHLNRPAILHIIQGSIKEYHSEHEEPRVHHAPSTIIEHGDVYHWWHNDGDEACVIMSCDLFDDGQPVPKDEDGC